MASVLHMSSIQELSVIPGFSPPLDYVLCGYSTFAGTGEEGVGLIDM